MSGTTTENATTGGEGPRRASDPLLRIDWQVFETMSVAGEAERDEPPRIERWLECWARARP